MAENIRVITLKTGIPSDTVSRPGFYLLNMGGEGTWLVDKDHPGYTRCVKKAIELAIANKDNDLVMKYQKYPAGGEPVPAAKLPSVIKKEEEDAKEAAKKAAPPKE